MNCLMRKEQQLLQRHLIINAVVLFLPINIENALTSKFKSRDILFLKKKALLLFPIRDLLNCNDHSCLCTSVFYMSFFLLALNTICTIARAKQSESLLIWILSDIEIKWYLTNIYNSWYVIILSSNVSIQHSMENQ